MKKLLYIFLIIPCLLIGQKKLKPVFGFSLNNGLEKIDPKDKSLSVKKTNAFGYYISAGFYKKFDSIFLVYAGIRWGRENSRFRIHPANKELNCRTTNPTLTFIFAPGIQITKRQFLFLNLGVSRVLHANGGGGGSGERNGREYTYEYGNNLPYNSWDFRPGLKWQIKPRAEKKLTFELGVEPSLAKRKLKINVRNPYNTVPDAVYTISYDLILFYFGIQF